MTHFIINLVAFVKNLKKAQKWPTKNWALSLISELLSLPITLTPLTVTLNLTNSLSLIMKCSLSSLCLHLVRSEGSFLLPLDFTISLLKILSAPQTFKIWCSIVQPHGRSSVFFQWWFSMAIET